MGTKYVFPTNVTSIVIDGHTYEPDENGLVECVTGSHVAGLVLLDGVVHNPETNFRPLDPVEKASVIADENTMLRNRLAEMEAMIARMSAGTATGADGQPLTPSTTDQGGAAPGGTATGAGGATTTALPQGQAQDGLDKDADKIKNLIASAPNTDDPNVTRDQLVAFLNSINVAVPGNISRDKAVEIVKDKVAGLNEEADKLASDARADAIGTATDAK